MAAPRTRPLVADIFARGQASTRGMSALGLLGLGAVAITALAPAALKVSDSPFIALMLLHACLALLAMRVAAPLSGRGTLALMGANALALMEVNAKFWGSHDLALAAGVDFPGDLAALMEGRTLPPQPPYRVVRCSWPLGGDLWHGFFRLGSLPGVVRDALSPGVAHTLRVDDPLPTWYELVQWLRSTPGAVREYEATRR